MHGPTGADSVDPVLGAVVVFCCFVSEPNTNDFHCAFATSSTRSEPPASPDESFVMPLSRRLSRSLTGTIF